MISAKHKGWIACHGQNTPVPILCVYDYVYIDSYNSPMQGYFLSFGYWYIKSKDWYPVMRVYD